MSDVHDKDAQALRDLDELKSLKEKFAEESNDLGHLVSALRNPRQWRVKSSAPVGYGQNSATNIKLPDLQELGDRMYDYQVKNNKLMEGVAELSGAVREMIKKGLEPL